MLLTAFSRWSARTCSCSSAIAARDHGFVVPIAIASFFGSIFSGADRQRAGQDPHPRRRSGRQRDLEGHRGRHKRDKNARADRRRGAGRDACGEASRGRGRHPQGFGDAAGQAFFGGTEAGADDALRSVACIELAMVRGVLTQHVMEAVSREMFGGEQRKAIVDETLSHLDASSMPVDEKHSLRELLSAVQRFNRPAAAPAAPGPRDRLISAVRARRGDDGGVNSQYNGYAHSFAGMGFSSCCLPRSTWASRCCSSGSAGSGSACAARRFRGSRCSAQSRQRHDHLRSILLVSFAFAMIVFRVRIQGSVIGFLGIAVACAMMARLRPARRRAGQDADAARGVTRCRADDGDARRRLGADVHLPGLAAADHADRAGAVGRRRPRRDDLAGHRVQRGCVPIVVLMGFLWRSPRSQSRGSGGRG